MPKPSEKQERTAEESEERPAEESREESKQRRRGRLPALCLAALGVVYGDIGTSPLYALRESFIYLQVSQLNVLGILSLIFWTLIIIISVKYMALVLRADNHGEGGTLALMALISPWRVTVKRRQRFLIGLGIAGAALLYGGAVLTPAVTVLSAVEGLHLAAPFFSRYVIPIAVAVLVLLFLLQKRGTAGIGRLFGPIMMVWFAALAALGIWGIVQNPSVLAAVNPWHAIRFFTENGIAGFLALAGVFLVVTGGEAMYADLGHFGRVPIRLAWFFFVLPALLLNYFGQGAIVLQNPDAMANPFYRLAPGWALYPLVVLATIAASIASQAVISGVFSLTHQATQLGLAPRMRIVQTSSKESSQVYVPALNWIMLAVAIALVIGFGSAKSLAEAYGVGISTTMVITTLLMFVLMVRRWGWPKPAVAAICAGLLAADLAFFGANLVHVPDGGWVPLLVALLVYTCMATWRRGRELMRALGREAAEPLSDLFERIEAEALLRVPGTGVFLTAPHEDNAPPMLSHHIAHNGALHERVVLLTVRTEDVPRVPAGERLQVDELDQGFWRVSAHYGFMQSPHVPVALRECGRLGLEVDLKQTTFYVGRQTLIPSDKGPGMMLWREHLLAFMWRNSARPTQFYRVPPDQVVELGVQVEI